MKAVPGLALRTCPVCKRDARTHREPAAGGEVVFYHQHPDGSRSRCVMSGRVAALRAVAFTSKQGRAAA